MFTELHYFKMKKLVSESKSEREVMEAFGRELPLGSLLYLYDTVRKELNRNV